MSSTDPGSLRDRMPEIAFAGLRVAIGLLFVWHGVQEHFGVLLAPGQQWAGRLTPLSDPWIVATVRLAGGALLALGLFAQPVAVILIGLIALTHLAAAGSRALALTVSTELALLYVIVLLTFAVTGPGMLSLDALRRGRRSRRSPGGMSVKMSPWVRRQYRRRDLTR